MNDKNSSSSKKDVSRLLSTTVDEDNLSTDDVRTETSTTDIPTTDTTGNASQMDSSDSSNVSQPPREGRVFVADPGTWSSISPSTLDESSSTESISRGIRALLEIHQEQQEDLRSATLSGRGLAGYGDFVPPRTEDPTTRSPIPTAGSMSDIENRGDEVPFWLYGSFSSATTNTDDLELRTIPSTGTDSISGSQPTRSSSSNVLSSSSLDSTQSSSSAQGSSSTASIPGGVRAMLRIHRQHHHVEDIFPSRSGSQMSFHVARAPQNSPVPLTDSAIGSSIPPSSDVHTAISQESIDAPPNSDNGSATSPTPQPSNSQVSVATEYPASTESDGSHSSESMESSSEDVSYDESSDATIDEDPMEE